MLTMESRQKDFPGLDQKVYLNTAAEGIPPIAVRDALLKYFADKQQGMDGRDAHFSELQQLKKLAAEFYGLSDEEIGVCSCSSEAYNLAALAMQLKAGDEVVINDLDFPAGVTPWLQPTSAATVRVWRSRQGVLRVEDLIPLLTTNTRLVTTSLVSFFNGYLLPLDEVVAAVRRHSAALVSVDVTQALGRIPLQLHDVDLIVSSTHKWILGTHGGCLVGVPRSRAASFTVPAGGWLHLRDAFGAARFDQAESLPGAAGFAVGMPNFAAVYAVRAALNYIRDVGVSEIDATARPLVEICQRELARMPVEMLTPAKHPLAGILAFRHSDTENIRRRLHEQNIHVMAHAGRLRIALHGYNTVNDLEVFLRNLHLVLSAI